MPSTTESITVDRPVADVFHRVADFGQLAEWDPTFDRSRRLDEGPLKVGSAFEVHGETAGQEIDLLLTITAIDAPHRVEYSGRGGDGLTTAERIEVRPLADGSTEVTYHSEFDTGSSKLVDAAMEVPFFFVGKAAIRGLEDWLTEDE